MSRPRGRSSRHRDWSKVTRHKDQYDYEKMEEKHNRAVEKFLQKTEKKFGKKIDRDWND
jgi:hypothetical protein